MNGLFVFRRALFWRVYLTLLASLALAVLIAAIVWHNRIVIQHHMRSSMHMPMMLLMIATAVGVAAYPAVARLTNRLELLKASVDAWGGGRLDVRADVMGRDEVAAVAASFNAAAERIEQLMASHRDLLAHASHELRSPLARLAMAVEMYASRPDPELRPQIMADIEELSALVDEILLASRLDHDAGESAKEPVDCLELAAEEAARAGVAVRRTGPEGAAFVVPGSPRLLRRMIRNLVDNAVKHGAPPVEVVVAATSPASTVTIVVSDSGPGLDPTDRERVFEPFYRPAGHAEADGSWGLGLSIVRQIALRHGGAIECRPRDGGGAEFVVTLRP